MTVKLGLNNIIWVIPAVCSFLFVFWLIPTFFGRLFAFLAPVIIYFVFKMFYSPDSVTIRLPFKQASARLTLTISLYLCALISITLQFTIGSITDYYSNWLDIPLLNYFRAIGFILIATLFSGYFVLVLIGWEERLSHIEKIVYSFIISVTITTVTTYCLLAYTHVFYTSHIAITTAVLLAMATIRVSLASRGQIDEARQQFKVTVSTTSIVLLLTVIFAVAGLAVILSGNTSLIYGDMWRNNGWSMMITREVIPKFFPIFHQYTATNLGGGGFPQLNMLELTALSTVVVFVLSFYLMARSLLKDAKKSVIATLFFTVASGFGGFLLIFNHPVGNSYGSAIQSFLNQINLQSMLDTRYLYATPFWFSESIITFICTFCLMHFLAKEKTSNRTYLLIVPISVFAGYSDRPEIAIFFVALLILSILVRERSDRCHIMKLSAASLAGLLLSFLYVDFSPTNSSEFLLISGLILSVLAAFIIGAR